MQEPSPGRVVAAGRCWRDPGPFQDSTDRGRTDSVAEAEHLTSDALVAPAGVVASHLLDQRRPDEVEWRVAGLIRKRPMLGDQPTMPRQDRGRGDQPVY